MLKRKEDEDGKHHGELVKAGKDAAEKALDFIASAICAIIFPRTNTVGVGWHHQDIAQFRGQMAASIVLVSPRTIHDQMTITAGSASL